MFEVGFQELFLLGVIALLVVGPERLPGLARTVGLWVGKARRLVNQVRSDVERELRADELRETMKENNLMEPLASIRDEVKDFAEDMSSPVEDEPEGAQKEKKPTPEGADAGPTGEGVRLAGNSAESPQTDPPEPAGAAAETLETVDEAATEAETSTEATPEVIASADSPMAADATDETGDEDRDQAAADPAHEDPAVPAAAAELTETPSAPPFEHDSGVAEEEMRDERAAAS